MTHLKNKITIILTLFLVIGIILRLYDLNWGAPFYFHPDERNITSSVTQLSFPTQLNPHFFAYGSLPIYSIYFVGLYSHLLQGANSPSITFPEAIIISRVFSAIFSFLLIPLLYFIGEKIQNEKTGLIAAFFATFSVGLIQFAHFGTFEMWTTFFSTLLLFVCLRLTQNQPNIPITISCGVLFGTLLAIKISNLVLFPLPLLAFFLLHKPVHQYTSILVIAKRMRWVLLFIITSTLTYIATNPFVFLDFTSFLGSMRYESSVATGSLPVFYTGEFIGSIPILYPLIFIYPFLLNPLLTILFIPAFVYVVLRIVKTKNHAYLLLATFYILLFFSQAFLHVQWTRYFVPTIPFIILIIAIFLDALLKSTYKKFALVGICLLFAFTILHVIAFVITTYYEQDTRLQAVTFAKTKIQSTQPIVSEVYDLGIIPFNDAFSSITLYDFYALDNTPTGVTVPPTLTNTPFIILPSQRIVKVRIQNPNTYPNGNFFYRNLLQGDLGFKKIYQTPCSIWCQIVYLNNPMGAFEGTASVFDRPVVMIFQKQ